MSIPDFDTAFSAATADVVQIERLIATVKAEESKTQEQLGRFARGSAVAGLNFGHPLLGLVAAGAALAASAISASSANATREKVLTTLAEVRLSIVASKLALIESRLPTLQKLYLRRVESTRMHGSNTWPCTGDPAAVRLQVSTFRTAFEALTKAGVVVARLSEFKFLMISWRANPRGLPDPQPQVGQDRRIDAAAAGGLDSAAPWPDEALNLTSEATLSNLAVQDIFLLGARRIPSLAVRTYVHRARWRVAREVLYSYILPLGGTATVRRLRWRNFREAFPEVSTTMTSELRAEILELLTPAAAIFFVAGLVGVLLWLLL